MTNVSVNTPVLTSWPLGRNITILPLHLWSCFTVRIGGGACKYKMYTCPMDLLSVSFYVTSYSYISPGPHDDTSCWASGAGTRPALSAVTPSLSILEVTVTLTFPPPSVSGGSGSSRPLWGPRPHREYNTSVCPSITPSPTSSSCLLSSCSSCYNVWITNRADVSVMLTIFRCVKVHFLYLSNLIECIIVLLSAATPSFPV